MKKPELLAPAGNMESLKAAIEAGCDAVYLGGYMFGARSFAGNFSNEEIKEAVLYAHLYGVKIYVTVNTLIYEDEVETFMNYIDFLYKADVDAVIIQDLGMLDLVRSTYPLLEIHASTQMHIHNLEGVKFVEELGVKRAVLARETDIDTILEIKNKTNIEIEIFVHGALCISYSGQCLMSSLIGGRSGNRGSCAGSCRQKYDLMVEENGIFKKVNDDAYLLSTKDLNTLEYLGQLIDAGVESFKIEGRMKRPEYVYLVVRLYRKAIDQYCKEKKIEIAEEDILELKKIFNREFTKGFLFHEKEQNFMNQKRPNHMGIPIGKVLSYQKGMVTIKLWEPLQNGDGIRIIGKKDSGTIVTKIIKNKVQQTKVLDGIIDISYKEVVSKGDIVVKTTDRGQLEFISQSLKEKNRKVPITLSLLLEINQFPLLILEDGKNKVTVMGSYKVERAIKTETSKQRIEEQICKFGDSVYIVKNCILNIDEFIFIPIKELNELRRKAIELLNQKRCYQYPYKKCDYYRVVSNFPVEKQKNVFIRTDEQYKCVEKMNFDYIYVEKEALFQKYQHNLRVIQKIPRVLHHIKLKNKLSLVGELGTFSVYPQVFTDWSLNVVNSYSVAFLIAKGAQKVTLSYELDKRQIKLLIDAYKKRYRAHPNLEVIVYGREEVMISKFHLLKQFHITDRIGYLKDRFSNLYPIEEGKEFMKIYNCKPRWIEDITSYYELGINSVRYQLFDESKEQIKKVIKNELPRKN